MWDKLQEIYENIAKDAHLKSQVEIRKDKTKLSPYILKRNDKEIELEPFQKK